MSRRSGSISYRFATPVCIAHRKFTTNSAVTYCCELVLQSYASTMFDEDHDDNMHSVHRSRKGGWRQEVSTQTRSFFC